MECPFGSISSQLGKGCIIVAPKILKEDGTGKSSQEVCEAQNAYAPEVSSKFEAGKITGAIRAYFVSQDSNEVTFGRHNVLYVNI